MSATAGGPAAPPGRARPWGGLLLGGKRAAVVPLCVFALATVMLLSAGATTLLILRAQPALVAPVSRVLRLYCDKVGNMTRLQSFLSAHHTAVQPGDLRDAPRHPGSMRRDNAEADAQAACHCDCSVDVAAALAHRSCPFDCGSCAGAGAGGDLAELAARALPLVIQFTLVHAKLYAWELAAGA